MADHAEYLKVALAKYRYPDITQRDVLDLYPTFKDLIPKLDTYIYNDGSNKELLCLDGTIPVTYKETIYNIPVNVWLNDTHPYNPPMVYVKPTSSMKMKAGKHVNRNGNVYLAYLTEWKHPSSDLLGLIQVLGIVFSEEFPLFAQLSRGQSPNLLNSPPPVAGRVGVSRSDAIPKPLMAESSTDLETLENEKKVLQIEIQQLKIEREASLPTVQGLLKQVQSQAVEIHRLKKIEEAYHEQTKLLNSFRQQLS